LRELAIPKELLNLLCVTLTSHECDGQTPTAKNLNISVKSILVSDVYLFVERLDNKAQNALKVAQQINIIQKISLLLELQKQIARWIHAMHIRMNNDNELDSGSWFHTLITRSEKNTALNMCMQFLL